MKVFINFAGVGDWMADYLIVRTVVRNDGGDRI